MSSLLSNLTNRMIIEDTLCCDCSEVQVSNCDLSRISLDGVRWMSNSINNSNAPSIEFDNCVLDDVTFYRSNLERCSFVNSSAIGTNFSGITLIRSNFESSRIHSTNFKYCTMQRGILWKNMFTSSMFVDFEGLNMEVSDCLFKSCKFEITSDAGMNGFSTANIRSCIFMNCDFVGYPFRGANVISCIFINCTGSIADDFNLQNSVGLENIFKCSNKEIKIADKDSALEFIRKWR